MKKLILCLLLIISLLCACNKTTEEGNSLADSYRSVAQKYIDSGDFDSAIAALEEGIKRTGDASLKKMLAQLQEKETTAPTTEEPTTEPTTAPTTQAPTTEPTTEPTTTEEEETVHAGKVKNLTEDFDATDWYRINIFLSNFSEQGFDSLDHNDAYALVDFAYRHNHINNFDALDYRADISCLVMSTDTTDSTLMRFFGHTVEHDSHSKTYPGGYTHTIDYDVYGYYFPAASGEFYGYISIANDMWQYSDGTYTVAFDVYAIDVDTYLEYGVPRDYYYMTSAEAANHWALEYRYSGFADVCDYDGGNFQSYQLLDYDVD